MYQGHVSILNAGIRHDPDLFCRAVTFAVLSIRQQFPTAVQSMAQVAEVGSKARALWGYKRGAYDYLRLNKFRLWESVCAANDSETALQLLTEIPGLGIVKAAFVLQMMGHDIGCIDSRNIARLGLNPREWRSDGAERKETPAFKRKIARYVEFTGGRAEELWNDWCEDAGKEYSLNAETISEMHLVVIPRHLQKLYKTGKSVPVISKGVVPF